MPILGGIMLTMVIGTFYAISVFMLPLEKAFGWTRVQTSWVSTISVVMIVSAWIIGGRVYDRKGPRIVAYVGGTLFSLAYLLTSHIHSLLGLYFAMGVCAGIGNGCCNVVAVSVAAKWFPDKRGLIVGLMVGSFGAGSGVFGPLASFLIERVGWRDTFEILGVIFFAMTMVAGLLVSNPPDGWRPIGWHSNSRSTSIACDVPPSEMVRSRTFQALWLAYCLGTTAGIMVISQLVPFARSAGHSAAVAAFALPVGALGNTSGRIFSGWMSDRVGRISTLKVVLTVSAVAMPLLYVCRGNVTAFYALLWVVYYCYGTQLSVYASTSADLYGTKYIGVNYGLLFAAFGVAGVFGPFLGGGVYVATGEYRLAFFIAAAIELVALAILAFASIPQARHNLGPVPSNT